jgi:hypothetical protein
MVGREGSLSTVSVAAFYIACLILLVSAAYAATKMVDQPTALPLRPRNRFKFFQSIENKNARRLEKLENNIKELQHQPMTPELILELTQCREKCASIEKKYLCPIGRFIMSDPVTISSGITYERNEIAHWLAGARKAKYCPTTRKVLPEKKLPATNTLIKEVIQEKLIECEEQFNRILMQVRNASLAKVKLC